MKKFWLLIISLFLLFVFVLYLTDDTQGSEIFFENDTLSFISLYESFNNVENGEKKFLELNLNKDAIIYVSSISEIKKIIENESGIVYFGFSTCPWCRNMIDVLLDASVSNNQAIYYVDIKDIRNEYEVVDGLLFESVSASDEYYELLSYLDDFLDDYIVFDGDDSYNTNMKRIYGPTVLTFNSKVLDMHVGTHDDVVDSYVKLSDLQYDLLYDEFDTMIKKIYENNSCEISSC